MDDSIIRIKKIAFTCYPVTDMSRARKFYETILQLKPESQSPDGNFVEYDVDGATFALDGFPPGNIPSNGPSLAFEVEDFASTVNILKQNKIAFQLEPMETAVCFIASVFDPEGNTVLIHKLKSSQLI